MINTTSVWISYIQNSHRLQHEAQENRHKRKARLHWKLFNRVILVLSMEQPQHLISRKVVPTVISLSVKTGILSATTCLVLSKAKTGRRLESHLFPIQAVGHGVDASVMSHTRLVHCVLLHLSKYFFPVRCSAIACNLTWHHQPYYLPEIKDDTIWSHFLM